MSYRTALAALWTVLMLAACWLPDSVLPKDEEIPGTLSYIPQKDKLVHAGMFGVFAVAWMAALTSGRRGPRIALAGLALAVTTELGQGLPAIHRDPSFLDALADVVGVAAGLGVYALRTRPAARPPGRAYPARRPTTGGRGGTLAREDLGLRAPIANQSDSM